VQLLLDKGADVNAQGGEYGNALQAASAGDHEMVLQMLLNKGADVNAQGGEYGNALQAASYGGHEKIVQTLLDKDADVNAQGGPFGNALQAASYEGHDKIVQLLLDKGADVNAQGGRFCNAPNAAAFAGHLSTLIRFFGHSTLALQVLDAQGRNTLHLASCGGHVDVFQYLLVQGLNPRQLDNRGNPMLSYSAAGASLEISQKILKLELGYRTDARWSPLHWACRKGNVALVKLLLAHGSNDCGTTTSNIPGKWTPHAIAIMHQNTELVSSDRILNHSSPLSQHLPPDHLCFSYAKQHGGFTCDGCQQVNLLCLSISIETDSTGYLRPTIPLQRLHGLRLLFYVYVT
jgi:ankyrin repeat protein